MKKQKILQVVAVGTISLSAVLGTNVSVYALEQSDIVDENEPVAEIPENIEADNGVVEEDPWIKEQDPDAVKPGDNASSDTLNEEEEKVSSETSEPKDEPSLQAEDQEKQEEREETREFSDPGTLPGLSGNLEYAEKGYRLKKTDGNNLPSVRLREKRSNLMRILNILTAKKYLSYLAMPIVNFLAWNSNGKIRERFWSSCFRTDLAAWEMK